LASGFHNGKGSNTFIPQNIQIVSGPNTSSKGTEKGKWGGRRGFGGHFAYKYPQFIIGVLAEAKNGDDSFGNGKAQHELKVP
jgi:hypothetical protein